MFDPITLKLAAARPLRIPINREAAGPCFEEAGLTKQHQQQLKAKMASSASMRAGAIPTALGHRAPARPACRGPQAAGPNSRQPRSTVAAAAATQSASNQRPGSATSFILADGTIDYYELLGVDDIATPAEIKMAYRSLAKVCHVDIAGDTPDNRSVCILLNEAYEVLMDPQQRSAYNSDLDRALADEDDGYTGEPLSKWMANTRMGKNTDANESRAVFVDEVTCIGCKQCVWCAPATFRMEDAFGRSRVFGQWLDTEEDLQAAMSACPVSCIHWVDRADLPALEFTVRNKVGRPNVASMMSQQGFIPDVWAAAAKYLKERKNKEEERARAAQYSATQEAARRAAAESIMNRQDGWFSTFAAKFGISNLSAAAAGAVNEAVFGSSDEEYASFNKVGRRRRSKQRVDGSYGARGGAGGGKVPRERALVPTGAPLRPWRREE